MARADRLERLDAHRQALEDDYRDALVDALQAAAAGQRGLFGHHADRQTIAGIAPTLDALAETGETIDAMRAQLAMEPFALAREFLAARGPVAASAVGESKQARAWLERMGIAAGAKRG